MSRSTTLSGVWKISATLRGRRSALLPKRIRFAEEETSPAPLHRLLPPAAVMEFGSLSIPYSEHCSGNYEVGTPEDDDAEPGVLRAGFIVECTAKDGTEPSRYTFDGLYDGERIAGTVSDSAADEVVADFLCTRLFTFWGTPKVKAVGEAAGDDVSAAPAASGRASAQQQLGSFTSSPMFQLEPPTQRAPSLSSDPLGAPAQHTRSHGASHPQPVRLPEARGALGLGCLDDGRASSHRVVVETRNELQAAPALPPGTHGLDLRDWLLLDEPSRVDQLAIKTRLLDDPILRQSVLQADDPVTLGAQMEALEMISSHVLWGGGGHARPHSSGDGEVGGVAQLTLDAIECWSSSQPGHIETAHKADSAAAAAQTRPPLERAARLVQEDLVLMRRADTRGNEYAGVAAAVCFSSGDRIRLQPSMREPLASHSGSIGGQVSGVAAHFLEGVTPDRPAWRTSWSLSFTPHPEAVPDRYILELDERRRRFPDVPITRWDGADGALRRFSRDGVGATLFFKSEYQAFRRLVAHDDHVLVTVHTKMTQLDELAALPDAAAALLDRLRFPRELDGRDHKGLGDERIRARVIAHLELGLTQHAGDGRGGAEGHARRTRHTANAAQATRHEHTVQL